MIVSLFSLGIIRFCRPDGTGLQSLVGILYLPFTDVRVLNFLFTLTLYYIISLKSFQFSQQSVQEAQWNKSMAASCSLIIVMNTCQFIWYMYNEL